MLVFGGICAAIANSKGRSPIAWFFVGIFAGCIGLIIILCLSNENERMAQLEAQNVQNRRLQEQLRQEQMKSESLRQHTLSRLDRHDDVLGIDTRETAPQLEMDSAPRDPFAPISQMPQYQSQPQPQPRPLATPDLTPEPRNVPEWDKEPSPDDDKEIWYYEYGGTERGPVSINELIKLKTISVFDENSKVRKDGMENWEPAKLQPSLGRVLYS